MELSNNEYQEKILKDISREYVSFKSWQEATQAKLAKLSDNVLIMVQPDETKDKSLFYTKQEAIDIRKKLELIKKNVAKVIDLKDEESLAREVYYQVGKDLKYDKMLCFLMENGEDSIPNGARPQDVYAGLVDKKTLCFGISISYKTAMEFCGGECRIVLGDMLCGRQKTKGAHAWNQVRINGDWFNVDLTNDAALPVNFKLGKWCYFLKSDESLSFAKHEPNLRDSYKFNVIYDCMNTKYNTIIRFELARETSKAKANANRILKKI